jgi:hypothetical protein
MNKVLDKNASKFSENEKKEWEDQVGKVLEMNVNANFKEEALNRSKIEILDAFKPLHLVSIEKAAYVIIVASEFICGTNLAIYLWNKSC